MPVSKTRKKKPVPKNLAPTSADKWKRYEPLEVPSGNVALVKAVGMETLIAQGIIPNGLLDTVSKVIDEKQPVPEMTEKDYLQMTRTIDAVVCACVVEPKVHPVPTTLSADGQEEPVSPMDREEFDPEGNTILYVDEVDDEDKAFIFQFAVGGTRDLEQFREERAQLLGFVADSLRLPGQAEPAPGDS